MHIKSLFSFTKKGAGDSLSLRVFLFFIGFIPMYIISKMSYIWLTEKYGHVVGDSFLADLILGSSSEFIGLFSAFIIVTIIGYLIRRSVYNIAKATIKK